MDFILDEPLANVSYLTELAIWILMLLVWRYPPALGAVAFSSWRESNSESGIAYISRFLPYGVFRLQTHLLGSASGGLLLLRLGHYYRLLRGSSYDDILLELALLSGAFWGFFLFRSLTFKLWRYILFEAGTGKLLQQDYAFQDWLRALLLVVLSLLSFTPLSMELLGLLSLGLLALVQLLGWIQIIRRSRGPWSSLLHLFLYLCAHEVVPFLYIIIAGTHLMRGTLLPNL